MNSATEQVTAAGSGEAESRVADRLLEIVPRATRRLRRQMRAHGAPGLTVAQLRALIYLRREPGAGLSALADHLGMSLPASSALAQRLVSAGLIDRSDDPAERRRIRLQLTPSGTEHLATAQAAVRGWLAGELAALTPAEQARLAGGLELLDRIGQSSDEPARRGAD
ncbi:MAG TPA: MarR family transcriptional regulator [Candidatus Limnocylindrales bacterium]|nr:MarR family transcriptional regulator [Candidatus Limnocylindrales bacterium]